MAARVVAISGLGSEGSVSPRNAALGWTIIIGTAAAILVSTLLLRPKGAELE